MFLHLSVNHSVHGGCLPYCMLGYTHPLGRHPSLGRQPPPLILWDTVNKRVVRIILECIHPPPQAGISLKQTTPPQTPPRLTPLPSRRPLQRTVRILLECILVIN